MSGFSQYSAQRTLDYWLKGNSAATSSPGTSLYLALFTADPADTSANEVSTAVWTNYARPQISGWGTVSISGTTASVSNSAQVTFNAVTGSSVTVAYWGIFDSAIGGANNLLFSGALSGGSRVLNVGDVMTLAASQLTITLD